MEKVMIRQFSKYISKKGNPYFFGSCSVSGKPSIKRFFTFNDTISKVIKQENQWIQCTAKRRSFEPDVIIIYDIVSPKDKGEANA